MINLKTGVTMSKDIKIRKYLIVDHTKAEFLIKAESWQQAHQLAKQMNMKVKAVFYEPSFEDGFNKMWENVPRIT